MKSADALELATKLRAYFPTMPERTVKAYAETLERMDHESGRETVDKLCATAQQLPTVATLYAEYRGIRESAASRVMPIQQHSDDELTFSQWWQRQSEEMQQSWGVRHIVWLFTGLGVIGRMPLVVPEREQAAKDLAIPLAEVDDAALDMWRELSGKGA